MLRNSCLLAACFGLAWTASLAQAQPPMPAPPKQYDVQLRYRIIAGRNQRIVQFFDLVRNLEAAGFEKDEGPSNEPEDASLNRMTGKIASSRVRELLKDRRVKSLLLFPAGYKLPEDGATPVKIQIELASGRALAQQKVFATQVRERLEELGFREPVLYDHRGYTRLLGTIPADEVETLFHDLRGRPTGWFTPLTPIKSLPPPLRDESPLVITEVIPEPEGVPPVKEALAVAAPPQGQEALSPDLRALLGKEGADKPRGLEVILTQLPGPDDRWQRRLQEAVPQMAIEGRAGTVVSVLAPPDKAAALAAVQGVATVRLPVSGNLPAPPLADAADGNREALKRTGLARLHAQGARGKNVRVAVIGDDFRGYQAAMKAGLLPKNTRLLDMTIERDRLLKPLEPAPKENDEVQGTATRSALAVALAAPEANLLLIRIDPAAMYQLLAVAGHMNGEEVQSLNLAHRRADLQDDKDRIDLLWQELIKERNILFNNFGDDEEAVEKRKAHFKKAEALKKEEQDYSERLLTYLRYVKDLRELRRVNVVVSTLGWHEGYAVDGGSALSRYLDDNPFRSALWFQPAGETRGQTWTGLWRDADRNGVMEFAPPGMRLPPERWTPEVNFLAWQPYKGERQLELPAKATLHIAVQWREAHDPSFLRRGEDLYRESLASVRLVLLRQRDPTGKKVGADEMEVVARSSSFPVRIFNEPASAVYEQAFDVAVPEAGRYAVRVEGLPPAGIRPYSVPTLSGAPRETEFRPRILLGITDAESAALGRPVFLDFTTGEGGIPMPGDAQRAITVGAAGPLNQPQPYSGTGPATNLELMLKPNFLTYDGLEVASGEAKGVYGSGISAAFSAGAAASLMSAGLPAEGFRRMLPSQPDLLLRIPDRPPAQMPYAR